MDLATRHQVCRLIAGIVVSDDDLDEREEAFLDRLIDRFGLSAEGRQAVFPIVDKSEATAAMRELPKDVQQRAYELLLEAAAADGKIVPEERAYLVAVGEALALSPSDVDTRIAAVLRSAT